MATYYVSSVSGDNTTGASWATAKTTVTAGLALATADGDIIYVDSAHSVNAGASIVWDIATNNTAVSVISVNRNGSTTTGHAGFLAGAAETAGAGAFTFTICNATRAAKFYFYGLVIQGATGANNGLLTVASVSNAICHVTMDTCTLKSTSTNSNVQIALGSGLSGGVLGNKVILKDCTFTLQNSTATIAVRLQSGYVTITNPTITFSGATKPSGLFSTPQGFAEIMDGDLSGYDKSGGAYFNTSIAGTIGRAIVRNCKLSSVPSIITGTWLGDSAEVYLINADGADTHNIFSYYTRLGTLTVDTSVYYNTGPKFDGSQLSWKIVTTAQAGQSEPFITPWMTNWSDKTSSSTLSLSVVNDGTTYTDQNMWAEFEYLSSASFPSGTLATTRNATPFDSAGTNITTDSASWTGTGGFGSAVKQILSSTFSPSERSLLRGRLSIGAASKTLYLNPGFDVAGVNNVPVRWIDSGSYVGVINRLLVYPGLDGGMGG